MFRYGRRENNTVGAAGHHAVAKATVTKYAVSSHVDRGAVDRVVVDLESVAVGGSEMVMSHPPTAEGTQTSEWKGCGAVACVGNPSSGRV
eukprot:130283-Amphidinium_carterae.1